MTVEIFRKHYTIPFKKYNHGVVISISSTFYRILKQNRVPCESWQIQTSRIEFGCFVV
jgi:hypothetical protein